MRVRVIGVGSPWGEDRLGWRVVQALGPEQLPGRPEIVCRDRPGLGLLDDLQGLDAAVLVDAMRGGGPPGSVRVLRGAELLQRRGLSTHELGVGASLALAEALGVRLPALRLVGIEAREPAGGDRAPAPRRALEEACAAVARALDEVLCELREGGGGVLSSGTGELL